MAALSPPDQPLAAPLALRLSGVDKAFGPPASRTVALRGADFDARLGELMMLVGPSGCGKTTLLSILAGTLAPDAGDLNVLGYRLARMSQAALTAFRRRHVGFVFQQFNLIPTLSVWENVAVPLLIQGGSRREAETRAREMLAAVGLAGRELERPGKLSGGQQQRVAIARALVHRPPCSSATSPPARSTARAGSR